MRVLSDSYQGGRKIITGLRLFDTQSGSKNAATSQTVSFSSSTPSPRHPAAPVALKAGDRLKSFFLLHKSPSKNTQFAEMNHYPLIRNREVAFKRLPSTQNRR
jgi:hypothetical protein